MNKLIFKLFYLGIGVKLVFVFLMIFLAGCNITGYATKGVPQETARNPEVYFCPRDDCSRIFENNINSANFSVYCAFYDIDLKNMISSLARKSKTADVRLVMDSSNYEEQVKGDAVRLDDNKQLMHNKFCVIDGNIVITGSFNPTYNDNYRNSNNILVVYSKALAKNYQDEFNELWNGQFGEGTGVRYSALYINNIKLENYFCPEDSCADKLIELISNAKSSIYFMAFSFTNVEIADAIIRKKNINIKGIFDSQQSSNKYSQLKRLQDFGIDVKKDTNKYKMHHKVFIIDNETIATGSFNPTLSADTKNDENIVIIHDKKIAQDFLREFDNLW